MPAVTAWIDELRLAFGATEINAVIKAGVQGQPVFWAEEGGHVVGCQPDQSGTLVNVGVMDLRETVQVEQVKPSRRMAA